jgi:hypothetical protein
VKLDHPPPRESDENQNLEPEMIADNESQLILTTFSREFEENPVRISETPDEVTDTDDKNSFSPIVTGGG